MATALQDLEIQVKANTTVVESVKTLVVMLADKIKAAGTDTAKLRELEAELRATNENLAAAVTANTPAADA